LIFGRSIPEARKAVVAMLSLAGAILALVLSNYDPSFTEACIALAGAVFAVAGVFMAKNHTEQDLSKAVSQLQGAALTVVGYFVTVQPSTAQKITIIGGAIVSVIGVWWVKNDIPYTKASELEAG
jgi:drug/metabolite transporter superfamily protein YnfA